MPRKRQNVLPVVDPQDALRRPRVWEPDPEDAALNAVIPPKNLRPPTTGETLMALRKLIAERTGEAWHVSCRLRPLSEEPDANFQVYARLAGGTTEWLGEYPPSLDQTELAAIVDDLASMRKDAVDTEIARREQKDADGEVTALPSLVGQSRKVVLADGNVLDVTVRNQAPVESATAEEARLRREIDLFEKVMLMSEKADTVFWNGIPFWIVPGVNMVPKPIADVFIQSFQASMQARARMGLVLDENQTLQWLAAERRGA